MVVRRVQITPKTSTNITRYLYPRATVRQVFSQRASYELDWSYEKKIWRVAIKWISYNTFCCVVPLRSFTRCLYFKYGTTCKITQWYYRTKRLIRLIHLLSREATTFTDTKVNTAQASCLTSGQKQLLNFWQQTDGWSEIPKSLLVILCRRENLCSLMWFMLNVFLAFSVISRFYQIRSL